MTETFGEYIHRLRIESNMTLTKLAAALDIDQSTLSKIENKKKSVPTEIIPKLATTFQIDIKVLEKEYFSEKIAEILYFQDEYYEVIKLAEEKVKHMKLKLLRQDKLEF